MKAFIFFLFLAIFSFSACVNVEQERASTNEDETVDPLMLNITSDPFTRTHPVLMSMHIAEKAIANEIPVSIFLNVDGVKIFAPGADTLELHDENLQETLKRIVSDGGKVLVCPHCLEMAGLTSSDVFEGVEMAKDNALMEEIRKEPTVLSY